MSYKMVTDSSQLKFAEKLVILNDRALGMLTRIYNMVWKIMTFKAIIKLLKKLFFT